MARSDNRILQRVRGLEGFVLRVRAGRKTSGRPAPAKTSASPAAAHGLPAGSVVTVAPIIINDERGPVFNLKLDYTDLVINDLFGHCGSRGITFVDTSETFRKFAQQEQALSRSGSLATPFVFKPIAPALRLKRSSTRSITTGSVLV